jgi:hypothetical protein
MIIQIINIQHVYAIKPENDPVILVDLHGHAEGAIRHPLLNSSDNS